MFDLDFSGTKAEACLSIDLRGDFYGEDIFINLNLNLIMGCVNNKANGHFPVERRTVNSSAIQTVQQDERDKIG